MACPGYHIWVITETILHSDDPALQLAVANKAVCNERDALQLARSVNSAVYTQQSFATRPPFLH